MKNKISKYISLVLISVLLVTVSCKKWIDTDINNNPDQLTSVPPSLVLPNIEVAYGFYQGGMDMTGVTGIFMNYIAGVDRQALAFNSYTIYPSDVSNLWSNYYTGVMEQCVQLIQTANASPRSPRYVGIARVLLAASLGDVTSEYGDVPFTEAFNGVNNLAPKYDSQQSIYASIQALLDSAIVNLATTPSQNYYPVNNDLIYNNDVTLWTKAAYTLKARYAMHLTKKGDAAAATAALAALANGLASSADDALIPFSDATPTENNPMYQFLIYRSGYLDSDPALKTLLAGDPRLPLFANDDVALNIWCQANTPVPLITYVEAAFLKAEASFINSDLPGAAAAYNDGLTASLTNLGVFDQTWFDANKTAADGTGITREMIITAKYIAICPSIEAWTDYRRTGFPVLTANSPNNNNDVIPFRYPYSLDEMNYNKNTPKGININSKPWAFQ